MSDLADRLEDRYTKHTQELRDEAADRLRKLEAVREAAKALMDPNIGHGAARALQEALAACGDES